MKFGSVCSGIEAASVAWHPLGWTAAWLSEIEPFPCAVLKHHYPDVPNHGDMTLLPEKILSGQVEAPDLFCGGTPCQAFSVAGLRNSLDDARGNLSLTFVGIANAIDHVRSLRGDAPAIVFWENVPGVLNTKDNAFGCFLGALAGESEPITAPGERWSNAGCVFGPQRTVAWRVLDAQYFGVAQRRRRVFVVASARDDINPTEILFEFEGVRRDTPQSREQGQEIAGTVTARFGNSRNNQEELAPVFGVSPDGKDTVGTLMARDYKGIGNQDLKDGRGLVLEPIAFPSTLSGTQCASAENIAPSMGAKNPTAVAQPVVLMDQGGSVMNIQTDGTVGTLRRETHGHEPAIVQAMSVRRLTAIECERLQGFPDNYSNIPWRGKAESPDGIRYKALGNSWAVPVVAWIGQRIQDQIK
jgi:DNA (cytosine-5)-methyltransferase 1